MPSLPPASALSICLAAMMPLPAVAGDRDPATDCTSLDDDAARLACYDQLHGRTKQPAVPAPGTSAALVSMPDAATAADLQRLAPQLTQQWDLNGGAGAAFAPRPYRPVYILPATWTDRVNRRPASPAPDHAVSSELDLKALESKYQISLKARFAQNLLGTPVSLWGGYTQSSRWQLYNGPASRPFRETNYEPELILVWPLSGKLFGWQVRMASLALNHQSNGRSLPLSRSWNRVIATLAAERGDWVAELRPWVRLGEAPGDDDNPDIEDHVGRAEVRLGRHWGDHAFTLQARHSLRGGGRSRGSVQADWAFPITGALHGYLQVFSGHGESLVDYNVHQTKLGLGVTIAGWR